MKGSVELSENLGLQIIAKLDENKSEQAINQSINNIQKKVNGLSIKMEKADLSVFSTMSKSVNELTEKMKDFNSLMDKVKLQSAVVQTSFLKDGTKIKTEYNALNTELNKTIQGTKDYATASQAAGKIASDNAKKIKSDYDALAKTVHNASLEMDKVAVKSVNGKTTQTVRTSSNGNGVKVKTTDNLGKDQIIESTENYKKQASVLAEINKLKTRGTLVSTNLTDKYGSGSFDASRIAKINAEVNALSINTRDAKSETLRLGEAYNLVDKEAKQSYTNQKAQQQALNNATRLQNKFPTLSKSQDMSKIVEQIRSLDPAANNSKRKISELRVEMEKLHAAATSTARDSMTLGQQMQQAFSKFATWISATSAFYATLRGVKNIFTQILEINKQMTEISRVSDDQTNVQTILSNNVAIAKELGNAIADINESAIEFARQGFKGQDLTEITKVATLLSNISELDGKESSSVLTASMKAFNVSAKETIHVVDALNEVDNNYAISTKQLAEGMQKSGAAAATYGVTLENLLGYETAIGEISRESGSVLGNSLKTIFSRMTNNGNATAALKETGVALYDTSGELRRIDEIVPDLAEKWTKMSTAEQQHTAVSVAGMYQQSRLTQKILRASLLEKSCRQ